MLRARAAECNADFNAYCEKVEQLQNAVKGYQMRWESRVAQTDKFKKRADKLTLDAEDTRRRAKILEDMEHSLEGFAHSVKTIFKQSQRGMLRGIHGPVTRLIETPADMALAIETALGAAVQYIVCDNEDNAKVRLTILKKIMQACNLLAAVLNQGQCFKRAVA